MAKIIKTQNFRCVLKMCQNEILLVEKVKNDLNAKNRPILKQKNDA